MSDGRCLRSAQDFGDVFLEGVTESLRCPGGLRVEGLLRVASRCDQDASALRAVLRTLFAGQLQVVTSSYRCFQAAYGDSVELALDWFFG